MVGVRIPYDDMAFNQTSMTSMRWRGLWTDCCGAGHLVYRLGAWFCPVSVYVCVCVCVWEMEDCLWSKLSQLKWPVVAVTSDWTLLIFSDIKIRVYCLISAGLGRIVFKQWVREGYIYRTRGYQSCTMLAYCLWYWRVGNGQSANIVVSFFKPNSKWSGRSPKPI